MPEHMKLTRGEYRADRGSRVRAYGTPKELWGFRLAVPRGNPERIAKAFLKANADTLGIEDVLPRLKKRAVLHGVGATHVILQQIHDRVRIHRGFVTVHIARNSEIYLVKSRATPPAHLPKDTRFSLTSTEARDRALRYLEEEYGPADHVRASRFVKRWYFYEEKLRPAWRVRVHRYGPREEWIIYIDARTSRVLSEYDNLSWARGKARVFDPNPLVSAGWKKLYDLETHDVRYPPSEAFKTRRLRDLRGRKGYLDGRRVSTRLTVPRVRKSDRDYRFSWRGRGFHEAMAYYHIDEAVRYVESLGYTGERALFKDPIEVNALWGDEDNSNFDPVSRSLQFGTGGVPDAEDAEVILHEFGHALQDAICPDFGQSHQAAAMGEGFGDYLAASFFESKKPAAYRDLVMSWSGLPWEEEWEHDGRPYLRRLDSDLTYQNFVHRYGYEHSNGPIWSATLWDIRKKLGRDVADRIILDSHFQLDGYTKIVRGARAIIDADSNINRGRHVKKLRRIFEDRGIGPVHD
jgi:hypothetical protein